LSFANGAVLANNFVVFMFFWGGLLLTLYGLITIGGPESYKTAQKSFILLGFCDFCLLLGIGLLWYATGKLSMSEISVKPEGILIASFILMVIGATGKAGAMPFHTWIPDAAKDAPVSVMAFLPASLEKLLGIYLLSRICLDFFRLEINSGLSIFLMTLGALTIVLAVAMALIQKNLKRLLSYHAISQVGYMILGIGTGTVFGIAGGIFHMLNHAIYKSGLFLSAGAIEHRAGTTDLSKLGGVARFMPVTVLSFSVCALAISGVWPFNGFVSKEMIFHGSYETGYLIFTIAAWLGAILTFASFLKAGHSLFAGKQGEEIAPVKEVPVTMYIPMLLMAFFCILFGVFSWIPLKLFIEPVIAGYAAPEEIAKLGAHPLSLFNPIALISMGCLLVASGMHYYGWKKSGKIPSLASEPVHGLPVINTVYNWAENRVFDLYDLGIMALKIFAVTVYYSVDRLIDVIYTHVITFIGGLFTKFLRLLHNGYYANYLAWFITGLVVIIGALRYLLR